MDFEEMKKACLNALDHETTDELQQRYDALRIEHDALQQRYQRILDAVQDSIDAILRIAREGKTEL